MNLSEAEEINRACLLHVMYREGLSDEKPPSLAAYSLSQLIEARDAIRADNQKLPTTGPRTISMVCDDRLLAALFVAYNYRGNASTEVEPVVYGNGNAVAVVRCEE